MKYYVHKDEMIICFRGEVDNMRITLHKKEIIDAIEKYHPTVLRIDFTDVTFIDSTGIGFILARYKQVKEYKGELILRNLTTDVRRIFALSGIFSIIRTETTNTGRECV